MFIVISQLPVLFFFAVTLQVVASDCDRRLNKKNEKKKEKQELENLLTKIYMVLTSMNTFDRFNIKASFFGLHSWIKPLASGSEILPSSKFHSSTWNRFFVFFWKGL